MSTGPKGETTVSQPTPAQRTVARRAAESRATIPHLELSVPLTGPSEFSTAHLIRACARTLLDHPRANGAYRDGHFELYSRINIGVVLALEDSYLIPTVFDAEGRDIDELREEVAKLEAAAIEGRLGASAFSGATFTVWNAAALGVGQASLPVVPSQAGLVVAGNTALTLTCDHRILYGAGAATLLADVSRRLSTEAG